MLCRGMPSVQVLVTADLVEAGAPNTRATAWLHSWGKRISVKESPIPESEGPPKDPSTIRPLLFAGKLPPSDQAWNAMFSSSLTITPQIFVLEPPDQMPPHQRWKQICTALSCGSFSMSSEAHKASLLTQWDPKPHRDIGANAGKEGTPGQDVPDGSGRPLAGADIAAPTVVRVLSSRDLRAASKPSSRASSARGEVPSMSICAAAI